jgi:exopolysaccharide biosynthesis polyprenyl glycosylphosphotransferase
MDNQADVGGRLRRRAWMQHVWKTQKLKIVLVLGDGAAILLGFTFALWFTTFGDVHGPLRTMGVAALAAVAGLWAMRSQGLLLARVSSVRVVEITRTARAMVILAALMLLFDRVVKVDLYVRYTVFACSVSFVLVCVSRSAFRSWLSQARERGQYRRKVAIIGTDEEAARLLDLFNTHLDIGVVVMGVIGDPTQAASRGLTDLWLGSVERTESLVEFLDVSGVVVSPSGLAPSRLNELIRNLHAAGRHVHVATGIQGIDARRFRSLPLAHEPLFYVEAPSLAKAQIVAKRCFDIVFASLAIIVLSPVLLAVSLAVKFGDGGPVLFTQLRVGRVGRTFGVLKFRSMAVDAEARLAELKAENERQGPLFKMERDPRVTRVGRFLRESSLDELPQLFNVVRGHMSLVGPRPALPSEVENFSAALRVREHVPPGITGLWQVEARDNPSFEAYRRLDLFYVENWSITLDLMIIVGTIEQTVSRMIRTVRRSPKTTETGLVLATDGAPTVIADS